MISDINEGVLKNIVGISCIIYLIKFCISIVFIYCYSEYSFYFSSSYKDTLVQVYTFFIL